MINQWKRWGIIRIQGKSYRKLNGIARNFIITSRRVSDLLTHFLESLMEKGEVQFIYTLGMRDGVANALMDAKKEGIKLKALAKKYEQKFGEKHATHDFHVEH